MGVALTRLMGTFVGVKVLSAMLNKPSRSALRAIEGSLCSAGLHLAATITFLGLSASASHAAPVVINPPGDTLNVNAGVLSVHWSEDVVNQGHINVGLGGSIHNSGKFANDGTIQNDGSFVGLFTGELTGTGAMTNDGSVLMIDDSRLSGGTVTNNSIVDFGAFSRMTGGEVVNTLAVGSVDFRDHSSMSGGTITNNGYVNLYGASQLSGGTVTNNRSMEVLGSAQISGGMVVNNWVLGVYESSQISGGSVTNNQDMNLASSQISGGTVTNLRNMNLQLSSEISGGEVTNIDTMTMYNSSKISGGLVINDGHSFELRHDSQIAGGQIDNLQSIALYDSASITGGEVINTLGGGSLDFVDNSGMSGGTITNGGFIGLHGSSAITGGTVNNLSSSRVIRYGAGSSSIGGTLFNEGVVDGHTGALILTGDVSGSGSYEGNITFDGTFRPGNSPGLIDAETLIFGASNSLFMEVGGYGRGAEYDAIDALSVTLGGLLDVALLDLNNGFSPMAGDTFDLIIADQIMGAFSSFNFASLLNGLYFSTNLIVDEFGDDIFQLVVLAESEGDGVPGPGAVFILVIGLVGFAGIRRQAR